MVDSLADIGTDRCCATPTTTAANNETTTHGCIAGSGTDTIEFRVTGTILLRSTLPTITGNLTITAPNTSPGIMIDGAGAVQVMQLASGGSATTGLSCDATLG